MKYLLFTKTLFQMLFVALSVSVVMPAVAAQTFTKEELSMLPVWCDHQIRHSSSWFKYLEPLPGIHHYCGGLNDLNNSHKLQGQARKTRLHYAFGGFDYMIKNNTTALDHPLVPEIYLNRAVTLRLMGRETQALKDVYKAMELQPKFAKAYYELADFYLKKGLKEKALEVVTKGLRYLPEDKLLQRRYTNYGGKLPYPEPFEKAVEERPAAEQIEQKATQAEAKTAPTQEKAADVVPPSPAQPTAPEIAPAVHAPMGTPKNPYCRFCPE
jgi:tetratricopeptide (TPR) repeat protein